MSSPASKIHPLLATAAIAVVVVSLAGTASLLGWLPSRQASDLPAVQSAAPATPATDTAKVPAAPAAAMSPEAPSSQPHRTAPVARTQTSKPPSTPGAGAPTPAAVAQSPAPAQPLPVCMDCGKVVAVRSVEQAAQPSGVGAVAGAVVGGVLGNQVGGGTGKTLATVAGAVGGGMAGNEIEKRTRKTSVYEVDVQMENGARQSFRFEQPPSWREGDRVRVSNGGLIPR